MRKFRLEEKMEIQKKYEDGATQTELALEYNCSVPDISRITRESNFYNKVKLEGKGRDKKGNIIYRYPINTGDE